MTTTIYPCGCSEDADRYGFATRLDCPLHGLTPLGDEQLPGPDDGEPEDTICPHCGEDLPHHDCQEERRERDEP